MSKLIGVFLWRLLPMCAVVWALRGSAVQYTKVFKVIRNSSMYSFAYIALMQYTSSLETYFLRKKTLPPDLGEFIRSNYQGKTGDPSLDPWGVSYELDDQFSTFILMSCGPDKQCRTADDLTREGEKATRSTRGRPTVQGEDL